MYLSRLVGKTLRQHPSDANLVSHQLLARAGYMRGSGVGVFSYLTLGSLTLQRLRFLVREQLAKLGGQEVERPSAPELAPAEAMVRLVRREIDSYRQLSVLLFQMVSHYSEQPRNRFGLFGAAERPSVEIHALGAAHMEDTEAQVSAALERILGACQIPFVWIEAGEGGRWAYFAHPSGNHDMVRCLACGYGVERTWAERAWPEPPDEPDLPTEQVATPGCNTIAGLAEFLDIPTSKTLKMVFYSVEGEVTCIVIRGDRAVDETKLARVLGTDQYYASLEDELAAIGAVGGYASPIGLDKDRVRVVCDPSVRSGSNYVSGANQPDYHILNVNVPRDFEPSEWIDLALIEAGDPCPHCGAALEIEPAFALVQAVRPIPCQPEAEYLDRDGRSQRLWMASWYLDLGRLMAAVVEGHHDDYGIIWPAPCAPFDVHIVVLDARKETVIEQAEALYDRLQGDGFSVLYDDRDGSAGVKFNDADLIGIPLRLTVSKRSVKEGLIEAKWRHQRERLNLDNEGLAAELAQLG